MNINREDIMKENEVGKPPGTLEEICSTMVSEDGPVTTAPPKDEEFHEELETGELEDIMSFESESDSKDKPIDPDEVNSTTRIPPSQLIGLNEMDTSLSLINKDLEILDLKLKMNKSQADFLAAKQEVVEREKMILQYMQIDKKRNLETIEAKRTKTLKMVGMNLGLSGVDWSYDDHTGIAIL